MLVTMALSRRFLGLALAAAIGGAEASSLRFYGHALPNGDRVEIPLDDPARPIDVGGDFTLEFWLRVPIGSNPVTRACTVARDEWIWGNIVIDRDVYGEGDHGDFGIALMQGRLAFGVSRGAIGATACGAADLRDGLWHHIAATRDASTGQLRIFIDGLIDGGALGPGGDVSYRDGRPTVWPLDPVLVLGNEKHFGPEGFSGWITEWRISSVVRYTAPFVRPSDRFVADAATVALFRFDEGAGAILGDSSGATGGPSPGMLRFGGMPVGPAWSSESPFPPPETIFSDGFEI